MTDIAHELAAARLGALVLTEGAISTLEVTGKDRVSWLNGLVTCELAKLRPGEGAYGLVVAKNGKIQGEVWIVAAEDRVFVGIRADRLTLLRDIFEHHLIMEDAEMTDATSGHAWLFAHGPRATEIAGIARANGASAAAIDTTGLGGAAMVVPLPAVAGVLAAVRAEGGENAMVGTCDGWTRLRLERGVPEWGVDFGDDNYPQEASLEKVAVSFNKGCYLGQETVCMLELRGHVKRKLMRLSIAANENDVAVGTEIALPDGTVVGAITTRGPGESEGTAAALGYVKYKQAVPGTELKVAGHSARVV